METYSAVLGISIPLVVILSIVGFIYAAVQDWKSITPMTPSHSKTSVIKTVYFYLVSLISLFMIVFAAADLVNLSLRIWVFPKADKNEYYSQPCPAIAPAPGSTTTEPIFDKNCMANVVSPEEQLAIQHQRDAVRDLSFFVVGIPLFIYHWRIIRKETREEREKA